MKIDSQYQDKSIQDWAAQLKYLQSILIELDPDYASKEGTMIEYFWKGLCPSVQVKIEQCGRELNSFEEIIEKAVDTEAKVALRPCSYSCNIDQYYFQGSRPLIAKTNT